VVAVPTYTRQIMPSGRVPAVPIPASVARTGEEEMWKSAAQLGAGLANVGGALARINIERRRRYDEMSFVNAVSRQDDFEWNKLKEADELNFANFEDYDKWQSASEKEWNDNAGKIRKTLNKRVAEHFGNYTKRAFDVSRAKMDRVVAERKRTLGQSQYGVNLRNALEQGNISRIPALMESYKGAFDNPIQQQLVTENEMIHFNIGKGNFDGARKLVKESKVLDSKQKLIFNNEIASYEKAAEEKQISLQKIYIEQVHKSVIAELAKDPFSMETINALPEELRTFWYKQLKGDLNTYDPILFSGLKQQIRETPDEVNYMDIVSSVGNGLTPAMAQELFDLQDTMQRKDSPLTQSHVKRAHDRINDLQKLGIVIKDIEPPTVDSTPEEVMRYMNVFDEMHDSIDRNAELPPEQMRKFTEEMVKPLAETTGKGWLATMWGWTPIGMAIKLGGAYIQRERALRTKPMNRESFETAFKELYKIDPDIANKYWDRWDKEI